MQTLITIQKVFRAPGVRTLAAKLNKAVQTLIAKFSICICMPRMACCCC